MSEAVITNRTGPLILVPPGVALVLAALAFQETPTRPTLADLDHCPAVTSVAVIPARGKPAQRIIHLCDWHFISRDRFELDLRDQSPKITEAELDARWEQFLLEVAVCQRKQLEVIRWIVDRTAVRRVAAEGVTSVDAKLYETLSRVAWRQGESVEGAVWSNMRLNLGPAGRAFAEGIIDGIDPTDDPKTYAVQDGEFVGIDSAATAAREEQIVIQLLRAADPVVVVVLSWDHDLRRPIRRLSGGTCEYVRVATRSLPSTGQKLRSTDFAPPGPGDESR